MTNQVAKAIAALDGQSETARLLGVTPQAVQLWVAQGVVPIKRVKPLLALLRERQVDISPDLLNPYVIVAA